MPTNPGGVWSFSLGAKGGPTPAAIEPRPMPRGMKTRYYTPEVHRAAFRLPRYVQEIIR